MYLYNISLKYTLSRFSHLNETDFAKSVVCNQNLLLFDMQMNPRQRCVRPGFGIKGIRRGPWDRSNDVLMGDVKNMPLQ